MLNTHYNAKSTIFIPGWGFNSNIWKHLDKENQKEVLLNLPYLKTLDLDHIVEHLHHQIPNNANIIGWSLGGLIAIKLCARFPEKINKLVLITTTPKFIADVGWKGVEVKTANDFISTARQDFNHLIQHFLSLVNYANTCIKVKQHLKKNWVADITKKDLWCQYLEILFNSDLRSEYSAISAPTLHVLGERDAVVKISKKMLNGLNKNVILDIFKDAGHVPFLTQQQLFFKKLKDFLDHNA